MKLDNHAQVTTDKVFLWSGCFIFMLCADPEFLPRNEFHCLKNDKSVS